MANSLSARIQYNGADNYSVRIIHYQDTSVKTDSEKSVTRTGLIEIVILV